MDVELLRAFRDIVGAENVLLDEEALQPYSHDEFALDTHARLPVAVVRPGSTREVAAVVALCSRSGLPLTTRGGGTGLSAGASPSPGAVVLSTERMRRILDADVRCATITAEAGCPLRDLYAAVEGMGLFFPPHPGDEGATVGGVAATNAGGSRAVKYGTVRRFITGLQVVLANGSVLSLGGKMLKSSTGYRLLDLMVGSEGTLGVITAVTLMLLPPSPVMVTLVAPFEDVQTAIESVPALLGIGVLPCAVEFLEHSVIRCAERHLNQTWPASAGNASLMIILDGRTEEAVLGEAEALGEALEHGGAMDVLIADQRDRQREILSLRSMLYEALRPGSAELFDVCVPRSEIAPHVRFLHELERRLEVVLPSYGHAADGNIHTHSLRRALRDGMLGEELPDWREKHAAVTRAIYADAIARGGVISGEHGIGETKREYLARNLGELHMDYLARIRKALDPEGILNPGKVLPAASTPRSA